MNIGLDVEVRATTAGDVCQPAVAHHVLSVLAGPPVRVACHGNRMRGIRERGDIWLFPAGMSDAWTEDDASEIVELRLSPQLVRVAAEEMGLDPDRAGIEPITHLRDPQIEHLAWALAAEHRAQFPNGVVYRESLGIALAVHLLSRYRAPSPPRGGLARPALDRVLEHIEAHLGGGDVSLVRLARVAGVSASHFRTLFKRSVRVSAHAYVIQRRVARARALLLRGDLAASEVALAAGFSHQSHMARWMRRVLGVTPAHIARAQP